MSRMMLYIGLLSFILLVVLFQGHRIIEAFAQYTSDQARIAAETAKYKPGGSNYVAPTDGSSPYSVKCSTGEVTLNGKVVDERFKKGVMKSQFRINSTIPAKGDILDSNARDIGDVPDACYNYTWNGNIWGPMGTTSTKSSGGSDSETGTGTGTGSSSDLTSRVAEAIAITDLSTFTLKTTSTVSEIKKILGALDTRIKSIQDALIALPNTVTYINMSDNQITTFGYSKVKDPSDSSNKLIKISGTATPVVYLTVANAKDTFLTKIRFDNDQLKTSKDALNKLITDKTIILTDTLTVAANKAYPGNTSWLADAIKTINTDLAKAILRYAFYDSFINKNKVIKYETEEAEETEEAVETEETGDMSTNTLWAAIGPLGSITNAIPTDRTRRERASDPAPADPSSSPLFTKEIEERLVKDILTQLKDQKIMDRSVEQPLDREDELEGGNCSTNATSQGREWRRNRPDMSQYIRKDSIPCWNCSP